MNSLLLRCNESLAVETSARQLLAFAAVASTLSYSESAGLFHYSEQGVHAQVKRLERLMGCRLIQRDRHGLKLTGEGTALLPACLAVLEALDRVESTRKGWSERQRITVGASLLAGAYLLPAVIRAFAGEHPQLLVDLLTAPGEDVMALIASGAASIAVGSNIAGAELPRGLALTHWRAEPLVLVRAAGAPPLDAPPADAAPAQHNTALYHSLRGPDLVASLTEGLAGLGFSVEALRWLPSAEVVKGACTAGAGYGLLPRCAVSLEVQAGLLEEVAQLSTARAIWVCHPPPEDLNADARAFLHFLFASDVGGNTGSGASRSTSAILSEKAAPFEKWAPPEAAETGVSDDEWARLAPLFPEPSGARGRPGRPDRQLLNAALWVHRNGAGWRDLPRQYGPWQTAYSRYRVWKRLGVWEAVLKRLEGGRARARARAGRMPAPPETAPLWRPSRGEEE